MHDQTKIFHSFSEFNRGLHTRRYIKPTICTRDFLTTMSLDLRPEKEWGYHLAKATGVDVSTIVELNLEFVNIQSTYGLGYARACRKLRLNNNIISRILGLEDLVELRSLDLSFNSVERIEGLEKCVKLEELMLFHNNISKIEGLATLAKLSLLNLGCNQVQDMQEIFALRKLAALRTVNLERNPISKAAHYREHLVLYIPQLRVLDWKRILPNLRNQAYEALREDYRTFILKERSDEKRRAKQTALEASGSGQEKLIPTEYEDSLYKLVNVPEAQFRFLTSLLQGGDQVSQTYREQLDKVGEAILLHVKSTADMISQTAQASDKDIARYLSSFTVSGRKLLEGLMIRKNQHLDSIAAEVEKNEKEALRNYTFFVDDVTQDLTKLLMQLQQKTERLVDANCKKLEARVKQNIAWICRELEVLRQFERHIEQWSSQAPRDQKFETVFPPEELQELKDSVVRDEENSSDAWLDILSSKTLNEIFQELSREKILRLNELDQKIVDKLTIQFESVRDKFKTQEEQIFHQRMREIVDLSEQHKAEAYLLRKRTALHLGIPEEDEASSAEPTVKSFMKRRHKTKTTSIAGNVRPRKVEFESEEPLADYVVMKDIKEVVDQIANVPLEERERLFETRVVEVDDIADFIDVKDELNEEEFGKSLKMREMEDSGMNFS